MNKFSVTLPDMKPNARTVDMFIDITFPYKSCIVDIETEKGVPLLIRYDLVAEGACNRYFAKLYFSVCTDEEENKFEENQYRVEWVFVRNMLIVDSTDKIDFGIVHDE
jgi:hypothetical protein